MPIETIQTLVPFSQQSLLPNTRYVPVHNDQGCDHIEATASAGVLLSPSAIWALLKQAGLGWWQNNAPRQGAALAFYATFSLAPLLVITVAITGRVYGREAAEGRLLANLRHIVGDEMGVALQTLIASAREPAAGFWATVLGATMVLLGAAGLFGELRDALNTIWKVQPRPGSGVWRFTRNYLLSFAMVFGTAVVLLASLVVSAALATLGSQFDDWQTFRVGEALNFSVSFGVTTALFAMIYRFLPDAVIAWRDVWIGSVVTALLFSIGKLLIALYLGHSVVASAFGAAGSLAALLIWLYYSAQIFLFGAELTRAYATGHRNMIAR